MKMTFMIMIPADLDRLVIFFRHLMEIVRTAYPTVQTAEIIEEKNGEKYPECG
jgi:hypothetical protein